MERRGVLVSHLSAHLGREQARVDAQTFLHVTP
jgi:hypothetical protein